MAGIKQRGVQTPHIPKRYEDRVVVPCRLIRANMGRGIMVAQYEDTRDLVLTAEGEPIQYSHI